MNKLTISIAALIVLAIVGFLVLSRSESTSSGNESTDSGSESAVAQNDLERLGDLEFTDYDGRTVRLAGYGGKPLILNSWAAWCPFCRKELPDFAALQTEFPDIAVIAIDRAESLATAKRYSDELDVTGKLVLLLDPSDSFYKAIGGFTMPETIFVDKSGATVFHKRGPMILEEMREKVAELKLAE